MAAAPPEPSEQVEEEEEEDACRICHLPADAERPLRLPRHHQAWISWAPSASSLPNSSPPSSCWLSGRRNSRQTPGIRVMVDRAFAFSQHFFWGIISLANMSLNLTAILVICPLFFGWSLDMCTSKLFGVTKSQKLKLLSASSFASTALHWLIGCIYLKLRSLLCRILHPVLRLRVNFRFVRIAGGQNKVQFIGEPFYNVYFKMLPGLFADVIYVAMLILVPAEIAFHLVPTLFPFDITYFDPPTQGTAFWQAPRNFAELLSGVLGIGLPLLNMFLVYLIC